METDKPLVSILLAVYKPNEKWLIEQLISLNEQSYENLELIVYDDCSENPVNEELFTSNITNFSFKIIRGTENKGSNIAFEELTKVGNGEYFAYCDQDDIWEKDKISLMMEKFDEEDVTLVCCDLSIIDENSKKTHESIRDIRKRIVYKSGYELAKDLLISNFVTGCAMIVRKDVVLKAIPFLDELVHDQWIAIIAGLNGKIEFIDKRLVRYRQHSNNQTGILKDVYDKESYYKKRINDFYDRYIAYKKRLTSFEELRNYTENGIKWIEARKNYSTKVSIEDLKIMIKYRNFHKVSILIEIVLPFIPNFIFKYIIKLAKKGIL
ncbi:glycosyl transferase [Clostridium neonatale]|uniref:Glycosyl transferase n=2 Tax=Clostridiaceae TaxID=31979 RepID=A0A2A7MNZ1_9CLOT|nr:glycosyl transferase [Clostridium neonatale]PEG32838.1 glycosyl transferase [Clostridium neonatale]